MTARGAICRQSATIVVALVLGLVAVGCGGSTPHKFSLGQNASPDPTTTNPSGLQLPSLPPDSTTTTIAVAVPPGVPLPNPKLTPGVADPAISMTDVCSHKVPTDAPSSAVRSQVLARYGISRTDQGKYVLDHLIARSLGGSNDPANLWFIPKSTWASDKNQLDSELIYRVCTLKWITLADAQQQEAANWYVAFVRDVAQPPHS